MDWNKLKSKEIVDKTIDALKRNGIDASFVDTKEDAKKEVLSIIPKGSEVMTMSSETLAQAGIVDVIDNSGEYDSVKKKFSSMNREKDHREMQRIGAAPKYALGSVHGVTQDGQIVVASNTGSQLPSYAYGSDQVIWIVSTKKIVDNLDNALKRVYEHVLPLESERVKKAYGMERSNVSKLLIISREINEGRLKLIFVNEDLGF